MIRLPFPDRAAAARALADALSRYKDRHPVVLGIPRGGVPIARIVADALGGDLDVVLVRKLGAPGHPEYAIGAVDERGCVLLHDDAARSGASEAYLQQEIREQLARIRERRSRYAAGGGIDLAQRTVIVVDDGLATGATMEAALHAVRAQHPARLICAVPVAARGSLASVQRIADEVVCLATPVPFGAVGRHYDDFTAIRDEDVALALQRTSTTHSEVRETVRIPAGAVVLDGELRMPPASSSMVIFAHGSGSSRHSPRNRFVADVLHQRGIATLLFDLLTPQEDLSRATRFDIGLLVRRLQAAVAWARESPRCRDLRIGLFGASTGAAAALCLAATQPASVSAVVSRGGRPDLAGAEMLARVQVPVLLIVGGADREVLGLNRAAQAAMRPWATLDIVPGATHLFEEPGALEQAATLAADWFALELKSAHGHSVAG